MVEHLLLTGAEGFIGSHLYDLLGADGHYEVRMFVGDITREEDVVRNLRGIDTVCNLAALTYLPTSWSSPEAYTKVNYYGVVNFLKNSTMFTKFYQQSTSHVYGIQTKLPITLDSVPRPQDPYSLAKRMAEEAVLAYSKKYGFDYLICRPFNCFGSRQSKHFVVPSFIEQAIKNRKILVRGNTKRELLYVMDTVRIIKGLLDDDVKGLFQISKGETYEIMKVAEMIAKAVGDDVKVELVASDRPSDIQTLIGVNTMPAPFRWTPMEQALKETVEWYR